MTFAVNQPDRRKTTALIVVAVAVVAFLLGLGLVVLLRGGGVSDVKTRPAAPTSLSPGRADTERLTAENVQWQEFAGAAVPASPAGPRSTAGGWALGFARSEAGAVLAASNLIYRASSGGGPEIFRPTIADQVVGADKEKLLSNIETEYKQSKANGEPDPLSAEGVAKTRSLKSGVWAYRVDSYTSDAANINVLLRSVPPGGATYVNLALTVKWVHDDWRLVAPLNGQWPSVSRTVPDVPAGYTLLGRG